jgi:hypothetical protein
LNEVFNHSEDFIMTTLIAVNPVSFEQHLKTADWRVCSFWANNHPLKDRKDALWDNLIPEADQAETLEGECLRAACRLAYDGFNNGFCNNYSGAVKFLMEHFDHPDMKAIGEWLVETANCTYSNSTMGLTAADFLVQEVVKSILDDQELRPNTEDFFSYNDPEFYPEEDEDDDWYDEEDEDEE